MTTPNINPDDFKLTLAQEANLMGYKVELNKSSSTNDVDKLHVHAEKANALLIDMARQLMVKDNIIKSLIKDKCHE